MATRQEFLTLLGKSVSSLTNDEQRIIIERMGQLSDTERYKFRKILVVENLTDAEIKKYKKVFPARSAGGNMEESLFDMYFPKTENVTEHYNNNFKNGR